MSNEFEKFINENREAFDNKTPDYPAVLQRIQEQMSGADKKKGILVPMKIVRWAAAACIVLIAGAGTFWILQKKPVTGTIATITKTKDAETVTPVPNPQPVVKDLSENKEFIAHATGKGGTAVEEELALRKKALFAKLNDMESPSQRLTATAQAYELKNTDNDIVDALVKTMNNDPSTNVRLAALEALSRFYREAYVKKQLIASLQKQKDPMVQIELIQLLTKMRETTILKELDKIVNDGNTMKAVKDHAYSSIFTLRS